MVHFRVGFALHIPVINKITAPPAGKIQPDLKPAIGFSRRSPAEFHPERFTRLRFFLIEVENQCTGSLTPHFTGSSLPVHPEVPGPQCQPFPGLITPPEGIFSAPEVPGCPTSRTFAGSLNTSQIIRRFKTENLPFTGIIRTGKPSPAQETKSGQPCGNPAAHRRILNRYPSYYVRLPPHHHPQKQAWHKWQPA